MELACGCRNKRGAAMHWRGDFLHRRCAGNQVLAQRHCMTCGRPRRESLRCHRAPRSTHTSRSGGRSVPAVLDLDGSALLVLSLLTKPGRCIYPLRTTIHRGDQRPNSGPLTSGPFCFLCFLCRLRRRVNRNAPKKRPQGYTLQPSSRPNLTNWQVRHGTE